LRTVASFSRIFPAAALLLLLVTVLTVNNATAVVVVLLLSVLIVNNAPAVLLVLLLSVLIVSPVHAETIVIPAADSQSSGQSAENAMPVLERFRTYTGNQTVADLTSLFDLPQNSIVRQLPTIAISDGRTAVIIAARITTPEGKAISFSVEGATLLSTRKIKEAEWELKALPDKGVVTMSLLVMHGVETTSYPLTVAPPLPPETDLSNQGFEDYLAGGTGSGQAARDLNNDGRHDYLDDYIFTANFLAVQRTTGNDTSARQLRALKRTLTVEPGQKKPEFDPAAFPEPR